LVQLFSPLELRGLPLKNRLVVAPMCQYSAVDGVADDFHLVHLGRFALGGFGMIMIEATAVTSEGRISHGDIGLFDDKHIEPLARIARFLKTHGSVAAIQLSHAGRKGSTRRPWRGEGTVGPADLEELGDAPWTTLAPSALAHANDYAAPEPLDDGGIARIRASFSDAARRALSAGFEVVEVHCAHGYLLNQFLSPVANNRTDAFGGSLENRMRLPLQIVQDVRQIWPEEWPVFVRVSATDHIAGGWTVDDTIAFARDLQKRGVDVVDCSSGGFDGAALNAFTDYHVPYAARVARATGVRTMAAGLISNPQQAEAVVAEQQVDLVGLAREALIDPNWPVHAAMRLEGRTHSATRWPHQAAWALQDRLVAMEKGAHTAY
jgi:2,4-dienoyl-CoA reductase-like NADH-dependent reductase (Old Yellow Enzyme family)